MSISPKRILLVDDEKDLVELVSRRLTAAGYEVIPAYDGREALDQVQKQKPDLVLLDLMLPGMDGFKICRLLKFSSVTKDIPVLIFSARCQREDQQTAQECGADGYWTKPFDAQYLVALQETLSRN